jgi:hypothetical protein
MRAGLVAVLTAAIGAGAAAAPQEKPTPPGPPPVQKPGRSEPGFQWPSIAPGVDYTLPTEAEIKAPLDRIREFFVTSTPYRVIDSATKQPITDLRTPTRTAAVDTSTGPTPWA